MHIDVESSLHTLNWTTNPKGHYENTNYWRNRNDWKKTW